MKSLSRGFATRAIHHGYDAYAGDGAVTPAIHLSSTYAFQTAEIGGDRFAGRDTGNIYSRLGNPGTRLLEARLADLERAEAAVVTGSGMGAICSLLWTLLRPGDQLITDETLYGCTFSFFHQGLAEFGIEVKHVNLSDLDQLRHEIGPKTRGIYFETPANPNLKVVDIQTVAAISKEREVWVAVDNTFCTPYLQRPIELGANYVVHSATKYLSGHGDLLAGVVAGDAATMQKVRMFGLKDMTGACFSSFECHLVLRGLKTLNLRMDRHCSSALALATWLNNHPRVANVYYPGLESDPNHAIMSGQSSAFGGMISMELAGGIEAGLKVINKLKLFIRAVSLGDCESLAEHPATMTHATYSPEERAKYGIGEGLIRLSVGLEDLEDLKEDLEQALE
jgi:methionine-gamma-lyase